MRTWLIAGLVGILMVAHPTGSQAQAPGIGKGRGGDRIREQKVAPDTDGNCIVDEVEAKKAAERNLELAEEMLKRLKQEFDTDGDGTLNDAELTKLKNSFEEKGRKVPGIVTMVDTNQDWTISPEEGAAATEKTIKRFQKRNERVLARFDENKDGKLDEAEQAKAKDGMKEFREKGRNALTGGGHDGDQDQENAKPEAEGKQAE